MPTDAARALVAAGRPHGDSDLRAETVIGLPTPALRFAVDRYVGYRYEGFASGVHVGLPSRHTTVIISCGDLVDVRHTRDAQAPSAPLRALIGGLHAQPAFIHHDGNQHGLHLEVSPAGVRALFAMPAAELHGRTLPLDAVLGPLAGQLSDRLTVTRSWPRRFAALDDVLLRALGHAAPMPAAVDAAWTALVDRGGAIGIAALAHQLGWSRRHLTERFRQEIGLTPKTMARVLRFERARNLLENAPPPALGRIAAACGYADQAHLTREWREFSGASPTAWLAGEELPFVQDTAVDRG